MEHQEPAIIQKLWGHEKILVNGPFYCGKILTVVPNGMACSIHYHKLKTETFHILAGRLDFERFDLTGRLLERTVLSAGATITLPVNTPHRFWATDAECVFLEISTPDDPADSHRLTPSGPRPR